MNTSPEMLRIINKNFLPSFSKNKKLLFFILLVGPSSQNEFFNVTFILATDNAEVSILTPLTTPRIGHQLKHQFRIN